MKSKDKAYYDRIRKMGLCVHCRKLPPIINETLCLSCRNKNAITCKDSRTKQKFTIIGHYGGRCKMCDETDLDVLAIDHIDGGGTQHRKELQTQGTTLYRWLVKNHYPTGFQVLCFNCNMKKHIKGSVR